MPQIQPWVNATDFSGVWVQVAGFVPFKNPYPWHRYNGFLIGVQTLLETFYHPTHTPENKCLCLFLMPLSQCTSNAIHRAGKFRV